MTIATVSAVLGVGSVVLAGDGTYLAHLSGGEEVPSNESRARGTAVFRLNADGSELGYRLVVAGIDNVVAAHIHVAPAGTNGPVVAFLYGNAAPGAGRANGVISTGTITAADLIGPLAGQSLEDLVEVIEAGDAYVNVHTNDGDASTGPGPGDLPGGEIRGQMG